MLLFPVVGCKVFARADGSVCFHVAALSFGQKRARDQYNEFPDDMQFKRRSLYDHEPTTTRLMFYGDDAPPVPAYAPSSPTINPHTGMCEKDEYPKSPTYWPTTNA